MTPDPLAKRGRMMEPGIIARHAEVGRSPGCGGRLVMLSADVISAPNEGEGEAGAPVLALPGRAIPGAVAR